MKLQLISDLHSELWKTKDFAIIDKIIPSDAKDIVLVVAGDLDNSLTRIEQWFSNVFSKYRKVIYVCGNHEFYSRVYPYQLQSILEMAAEYPNVSVLENASVDIDDVTFLGTTLWSDNRKATCGFSDYVHIRDEFMAPIRREATYAMYQKAKKYLKNRIKDDVGRKKVIVTHHLPHYALVNEKWLNHVSNPYFVSNTKISSPDIKLWCFGHSHDFCDKTIDGTRYLCNPYGYEFRDEIKNFRPQVIVEV